MSFFVIMWIDGLVVKALECGQKGCGFKCHFEDSSLKQNLEFGNFDDLYASTNNMSTMLVQEKKNIHTHTQHMHTHF
jgi:hypothetical protein